MRRREFIGSLCIAAMCWSFAARAQQPAPGKWRIGMLAQKRRVDFAREGLRELGYVEGTNLTIDVRPNDNVDALAAFAAELVALNPNVVIAAGTQAVQAFQKLGQKIPIVMIASDPVGNGLVASLARPGGYTTGVSLFSPELSGKRIELLRTVAGDLSPLAVLWNPADPPAVVAFKQTQDAARSLQFGLITVEARRAQDFVPAFETLAKAQPKGLVVLNSPLMSINVALIAEHAQRLQLPSIYTDRTFPLAGGLMSYGPNFDAVTKRTAVYIDRIFRGEKPADLPVEQPTKLDLVINLKTAKALGLTIPNSILLSAEDVIE
jgi:putative ABC transport system substrate-binding protein